MCFIAFDGYCFDRCCGAEVFAAAATYAERLLNFGICAAVDGRFHHLDSLGRAVLGTVATLHSIYRYYASVAVEYGVTDECHLLLLAIEQVDSSRWAHLATEGAVIEAITFVITHYGLHHSL